MPKLSAVIITRNEEKNIRRCLESVRPVADEIVVVDSGSSDETIRICREFGCKVFSRDFDGYGTQKQFAVDQASSDWVLSIDADEVISEELLAELEEMFEKEGHRVTVSQGDSVAGEKEAMFQRRLFDGYNIPFSLFFMGRLLRHSGVGNEVHLRLFNRTRGRFTTVPVHEGVEVSGSVGMLKGSIIHYSYRDISHHLEKINTYTSQAAAGYRLKGKTFSKIWVAFKFPTSFIAIYFLKRGFLDGYPGFMWSFLAAVYSVLKVAKTIELTRKP